MMRALAMLLLVVCAYGESVTFKWNPAEPTTNGVMAYAVLLATNEGVWKTNAIRSPDNRYWSNDLPAGTWQLGVKPILTTTNSTFIWSCSFNVPKSVEVVPIYDRGQMKGTVVRDHKAYRVILNPQVLTNAP